MKSLRQIRQSLVEATQDTEAHFVVPTDAQQSVLPKQSMHEEAGEDFKRIPGISAEEKGVIEFNTGHHFNWMKTHGTGANGEVNGALISPKGKPLTNYGWWRTNDPRKAAEMAASMHDIDAQIEESESGSVEQLPKATPADDFQNPESEEPKAGLPKPTPAQQTVTSKKFTEALNAEKDPVEKWIKDYSSSTDPRFKGLDKSKRIKMALSDFAAAQKAAGKKPVAESHLDGGHEAEEISMTRSELDEIADMADDLFNVLPNFDECPAWVQHKVAGIHASLHGIYDYYRRKRNDRNQAAYATCEPGTEPDAVRIAIVSPANPVATELPVPPAKF